MESDAEKSSHLHGLCSNLIKKCCFVAEGGTFGGTCIELQELFFAGLQSYDYISSFACQGIDYLGQFLTISTAKSLEAGLTMKNKLLLASVIRLGCLERFLPRIPIKPDAYNSDMWLILGGCALCRLVSNDELYQLLVLSLEGSGHPRSREKGALLVLPVCSRTLSFTKENAAVLSRALCRALMQTQTADVKVSRKEKRTVSSGSHKGAVLELDGTPCRDIVTVLNTHRGVHSHALANIYAFSVLREWIAYLRNEAGLTDAFPTKSSSKLSLDSAGSGLPPMGLSQFLDEASSGSTSSDAVSLSSSMSSLQASFDADSEYHDRLDSRPWHSKPGSELLARPVYDLRSSLSKLEAPAYSPSSHWGLAGSQPSLSRRASQTSFDPREIRIADVVEEPSVVAVAVNYCLRVISQSERTPQKKSDYDVIAASVIESIAVLSHVCKLDASQGQRVFPEVKKLYQRLEGQPLRARKVYVAVLNFIIAHHKEMMLNVEEVLNVYLRDIPVSALSDVFAAYELFDLCLCNKEFLWTSSSVVSRHFPKLLKLVAWHPCTFMESACELMPLFLRGLGSVNELLHCILDLPSTAAVLELEQQKLLGDLSVVEHREKLERALGKTIPPYFKSITTFILRDQSGGAETISKLAEFHSLLLGMDCRTRVKYVGDVVCPLLAAYFSAVESLNDRTILANMFPVLLERAHLLFPQGDFRTEVQEFLADKVEWVLRSVPGALAEYQEEVLASLSQSLVSRGCFARVLVYCIGEFSTRVSSCDYEQVAKYYDRIETLAYEAVHSFGQGQHSASSPEMMSTIISCLSKLAAYNQELAPRAVVCLSKVSTLEWCDRRYDIDFEEFLSLITRAQEMIGILDRPKAAPALLCGDARSVPWHLDGNSSLLLKVQALC